MRQTTQNYTSNSRQRSLASFVKSHVWHGWMHISNHCFYAQIPGGSVQNSLQCVHFGVKSQRQPRIPLPFFFLFTYIYIRAFMPCGTFPSDPPVVVLNPPSRTLHSMASRSSQSRSFMVYGIDFGAT